MAVSWTPVATVKSDSHPGVTYEIKRAPDGRHGCTCMAYRFKKGEKTCRHLRAWSGDTPISPATEATMPHTITVATATEIFTFTRALNLSEED